MYPDETLGVLAIVQSAVTQMLLTSEPAFLDIGQRVFMYAAIAMLSWHGLSWLYMPGASEAKSWEFARIIVRIATGLTMLVFYESPIPGIGISASNVVTDSTAYLASILDARSVELAFRAIDDLWSRAVFPDWTNIGAMLMWFLLYLVVAAAKAATLAVVSYALIASAACALVGPLFCATYAVPALSFLFVGWVRSFVSYSFLPVMALAYLNIGQHVITAFVERIPPTIDADIFPLYIVQMVVVLLVFVTGIVALPFLNSSLFSGHSTGGSGAGILTTIIRRGK